MGISSVVGAPQPVECLGGNPIGFPRSEDLGHARNGLIH